MSKNEIVCIVKKYFNEEENSVRFFGNISKDTQEILSFLEYAVSTDNPDAYSLKDNEVLIIEHFEFDSTNNNKKGSELRQKEAQIERDFEAFETTEQGRIFRNSINVNQCMENYKTNVTNAFNQHYGKIPNYIKNLKLNKVINNNTKIRTMFIIEDTTTLGNIYLTNDARSETRALVLPLCDFFIEIFENSPDLDCVLSLSMLSNVNYRYFINKDSVEDYKKEQIKTEEIKILDFTINQVGYKILLPKDVFVEEKSGYNE